MKILGQIHLDWFDNCGYCMFYGHNLFKMDIKISLHLLLFPSTFTHTRMVQFEL